jgi:hypothetical protein
MKILPSILHFASACLLVTSANGFAAPLTQANFSLQEWKISKIHCPGCDKQVTAALQSQIGKLVKLGPSEFSGQFIDTCDGPTEVVLKNQARQEKLDEIKEAMGPEVKFNPSSLQLPAEVVSASVFCQGTNGVIGGAGARILSIEDKRLLILFGEQAILELRK